MTNKNNMNKMLSKAIANDVSMKDNDEDSIK